MLPNLKKLDNKEISKLSITPVPPGQVQYRRSPRKSKNVKVSPRRRNAQVIEGAWETNRTKLGNEAASRPLESITSNSRQDARKIAFEQELQLGSQNSASRRYERPHNQQETEGKTQLDQKRLLRMQHNILSASLSLIETLDEAGLRWLRREIDARLAKHGRAKLTA